VLELGLTRTPGYWVPNIALTSLKSNWSGAGSASMTIFSLAQAMTTLATWAPFSMQFGCRGLGGEYLAVVSHFVVSSGFME
jgi:hypothetical protein